MFRRILFFCIFIIGQKIFAQISITGSEYASLFEPGKTWNIFSADTLKNITMDIGEASSNSQVWALPVVQFRDTSHYININPSGTPFASEFSNATHASSFSFSQEGLLFTNYLYFIINNNVVISLGGGTVYNGIPLFTQINEDTLFHPPLTLGSHMQKKDTVVKSQGVVVIDSKVENVDAFGTINLPNGTFDALRATSTTESKTYVDGNPTGTSITKSISFLTKFGNAVIELDSATQFTGNIPVKSITVTLFSIPTSVDNKNISEIRSFELEQNYPNPFNPVTTISYSIPTPSISSLEKKNGIEFVTLKIYDILGREVATLLNKMQSPGKHEAKFDGSNLNSGVYLYRLQAGDYTKSKKMLLLK